MLVAALAIWGKIHQQSLVSPVRWQTSNPITSPRQTHAVQLSGSAGDKTKALSLPRGHLPHTDWYLPISSHAAITYVLHDGQARWLVNGHAVALRNAPTDPVGHLVFAPNGQELAWPVAQGVSLDRLHQPVRVIPQAIAAYFTPRNTLDYVSKSGKVVRVHSQFPSRALPATVRLGYHPFVRGGRFLVYDQAGQINLLSLSTGTHKPILSVRSSRWPELVDSISYNSHIALLLRRPSALPAYLLAVTSSHGVLWYRWKTGLKPQIGLSAGHLVINNLDASGQLVTLGKRNLHPLPQSTGLFSQSPKGVIFQSNRGFSLLSRIG